MKSNAALLRVIVLCTLPAILATAFAWRALAATMEPARDDARRDHPSLSQAPLASVPEPATIDVASLPMPQCWTCRSSDHAKSTFDLDVIAPLGDGTANAAEWFADFSKDEPRAEEGAAARARRVPVRIGGLAYRALPPDDALLAEAEPWVDQALCRFYPDVWSVRSPRPTQPNLLLMQSLAKSWIARADAQADPIAGERDARRAIRLGRLLLQDDVTVAQDLVGKACIRLGLESLHRRARAVGDLPLALATSLALADIDGMRGVTAERMGTIARIAIAKPGTLGGARVTGTDADVQALVAIAKGPIERRFRIAALPGLRLVADGGTGDQQELARAALVALAFDYDAVVAAATRGAGDSTSELPQDAEP